MTYTQKMKAAVRGELFEAARALQAAREALEWAQARYDLATEADDRAWGEAS